MLPPLAIFRQMLAATLLPWRALLYACYAMLAAAAMIRHAAFRAYAMLLQRAIYGCCYAARIHMLIIEALRYATPCCYYMIADMPRCHAAAAAADTLLPAFFFFRHACRCR